MDAIRTKLFRKLESMCNNSVEIRDLLDYEQPTKYIVASEEYLEKSQTPVLTANKAFILGYTNEVTGIYDKGECIIFDDFTMDVKFVTFPFKVKSSAIKILTAKPNVDLYFMYQYIQYLGLLSEEHKRHYISEIEPMSVICPSIQEQSRISTILSLLDKQYECKCATVNLLNKQKQYFLSQMFI